MRRQRRLHKDRISPGFALAVAFISSAVIFVVMLVIHVNIDRIIGTVGILFALVTFGLSQLQIGRPSSFHIAFVGKSHSPFTRTIFRGVKQRLDNMKELRLTEFFPDDSENDLIGWQLRTLRSDPIYRRAAAVIILPAGDVAELWTELAMLIRKGTFVIAVDVKATNRVFTELGTRRPAFVGSDFGEGGLLIAAYLIQQLQQNANATAIICLGPSTSWQALERGGKLTYRLSASGQADRVRYLEINSWNVSGSRDKIIALLQSRAKSASPSPVYVFCANDRILCAVQEAVDQLDASLAMGLRLIGYDGVIDEDGEYVAAKARCACVTVDALPLEQGKACGDFLLSEYYGDLINSRSTFIVPKLQIIHSHE